MQLDDLRSLPTVQFVSSVFAAVALAKMAPLLEHSSEYMPLGEREASTLTLYKQVITKFEQACADGYASQLKPFLDAFRRLESLYSRSKDMCMRIRPTPGSLAETPGDLFDAANGDNAAGPSRSAASVPAATNISWTPDSVNASATISSAAIHVQPSIHDDQVMHNLDFSTSDQDGLFATGHITDTSGDWAGFSFTDGLLSNDFFPEWLYN